MSTLPSPSPGVVVRVRLGAGLCYSSKRLTAADADALASATRDAIKAQNGGWGFVQVADAVGGTTWVRAQRVTAIEVRRITGDGG